MTRLQVIRYSTWGTAAVVLVIAAALTWTYSLREPTAGEQLAAAAPGPAGAAPEGAAAAETVTIGGPFTLVSDAGEMVTEAALIGHPTLMFFGFTTCPDVCPTALAEASAWLDALGPDAADLQVYFVTVDPERDTPEQLTQYLSAFHPAIVGLSGPVEAVHDMLGAYRVFYRKVPLEGGDYTMDHYASFFLLDDAAEVVDFISANDERSVVLARLRDEIARAH